MAPVALIGAGSGWGAGYRQTEAGPAALRDWGLAQELRRAGIDARWSAMIEPERSWREAQHLRGPATYGLVLRHAAAVGDAVVAAVEAGCFPVVIGGDHAIEMGTWSGLSRALGKASLGVVWLDAHLDAHTLETTPSQNAHGMGVAALLGLGHLDFVNLAGGTLRPEHICLLGIRSYEPEEMDLLCRLGARIIPMPEVTARGMNDVLAEGVAIATRGTQGFGFSIDLDGFEPEDAPGIGLKEPNGLHAGDTVAALAAYAGHSALKAIEIVEYIPEFDVDHRTAKLVRDLLIALLRPAAS
jgi:arginase